MTIKHFYRIILTQKYNQILVGGIDIKITTWLIWALLLCAVLISGCTEKKTETAPAKNINAPYVDRTTPAEEQKDYNEDTGDDEQDYVVTEESGISYIGTVPNIAATQIADDNRCVIKFQVYNPRANEVSRPVQNLYEFDSIKLSIVVKDREEKEYAPVKLGKTIKLYPGRSFTKTVASGNVLEDLDIDNDVPLTCWAGFCKDDKEIFAIEMEIPSQKSQGKPTITQIIDPSKKDWDQ